MKIKDLKINDEVSVMVSSQRLRDTDDENGFTNLFLKLRKL